MNRKNLRTLLVIPLLLPLHTIHPAHKQAKPVMWQHNDFDRDAYEVPAATPPTQTPEQDLDLEIEDAKHQQARNDVRAFVKRVYPKLQIGVTLYGLCAAYLYNKGY